MAHLDDDISPRIHFGTRSTRDDRCRAILGDHRGAGEDVARLEQRAIVENHPALAVDDRVPPVTAARFAFWKLHRLAGFDESHTHIDYLYRALAVGVSIALLMRVVKCGGEARSVGDVQLEALADVAQVERTNAKARAFHLDFTKMLFKLW